MQKFNLLHRPQEDLQYLC